MKSSPKVLFLNHTSTLGGAEIVLFDIVSGLFERGVDVQVALFSDGDLADKFRATKIPLHLLPLDKGVGKPKAEQQGGGIRGKVSQLRAVLQAITQVRKFILRSGAEVVYCNSLKSFVIGGIATRLARRKMVWHLHDRISPYQLTPTPVKILRLLSRWLPTHTVAISQSVADTLPALPGKISVVHNGIKVDVPKNSQAKIPFSDESPVFGLIGRISPWKGQDVFLEAAKIVVGKYPHARFQIVGDALFGEADFKAKVIKQCHDSGLDDVVSWLGFRNDVPEIMAQLDCVVHASILGEPFGMVIIEAMLAERPVIATNGGGVPEIVTSGQDGLLVPMNDARAMAEAMIEMLQSPATARALASNAHETVTARFSIEKTLDGIEAVLGKIKK